MAAPEPTKARRVRPLLAIVALSLSVAVAVPIDLADADLAAADLGSGTLELVAQSYWVPPNGTFDLEVRAVGAPPGATLDLSLRSQTLNRDSFRRGLDENVFRLERYATPRTSIDELAPRAGVVSFSLQLAESESDIDPAAGLAGQTVVLTDGGVYPVVVTLRDADGRELDTLATHLIRAPQLIDEIPLAVGLVLPVTAPLTLQPDGSRLVEPAARRDAAAVIDALDAHRELPLSLDITPDALLGLQETEPELVERLGSAVEGREVLGRPLVDADATAWLEAGLTSEFVEQLSLGLATVSDVLGVEPTTTTWLSSPTLTAEALSQLRSLGVTGLVLPEDQLEPLDLERFPLTLTQLFDVLDGNDVAQPTAVVDAGLTDDFTQSSDPVLAAHNLIADLSILFFDQPGTSRGVIVVPPSDWTPSERFLNALLPGLTGHPLVEAMTVDGLFEKMSFAVEQGQQATFGFRLQRDFTAVPAANLGDFAQAYTEAAGDVVSFEGMLPPGSTAADGLRGLLLSSGSAELTAAERQDFLDEIDDRIAIDTSAVSVLPPGRVTLASRTDDIPLVINNSLDHDVNVVIGLTGDKLEFPQGAELELTLASGVNRVDVPISTRTSGDSTLTLRVTSPDRAIELTSTRVAIRSTAISGVGLVIAVVALGFLVAWWIRHARADRRSGTVADPGYVDR